MCRESDEVDVRAVAGADGPTRMDLMEHGRSVSHLWIVPITLRIGAAAVRMDGIGGVWTERRHRNRGCARRLLCAAVERMCAGSAALSMLYGIRNFYPRFGYATAGADHFILLTELDVDAQLPPGWRERPCRAGDLRAIMRIYDEQTARDVGAAIRAGDSPVWVRLAAASEDAGKVCRVVEDPEGRVSGYAWRDVSHWYVGLTERNYPGGFVISEALADSPLAADAVVAVCRRWAGEQAADNRRIRRAELALPHTGLVAAAARYQTSQFVARFASCGGSMARTLSAARLLEALRPEFRNRLAAGPQRPPMRLHLRTDLDSATLSIVGGEVTVTAGELVAADAPLATVDLPQSALARLALGAFPPGDILSRLAAQIDPAAREAIETLFPARTPHMYLPDRF